MKFTSALVPLCLALCAAAAPTKTTRSLATIESAIAAIQSAVNALDTAENAYTSGDPTTVQSASNAVVSATDAGTATANASADLDLGDAVSLISPIDDLTSAVQTAVNDIIAKKSAIVAAGYESQTLADLVAQNTSAAALATAITAKVPASLQSTAAQLSAGITTAIGQGITAFSS